MAGNRDCGEGIGVPAGPSPDVGGGPLGGSSSTYLNQQLNVSQQVPNENRQMYLLQQTLQDLRTQVNVMQQTVNNVNNVVNNFSTGDNTGTIRDIAFGIAKDAKALEQVAVWVPFRE